MFSIKASKAGIEKLEYTLLEKRINKVVLADKAGIARATVINFFSGRRILVEKAKQICQVLEISLDDIKSSENLEDSENRNESNEYLVRRVSNKIKLVNNSRGLNLIRVLEMKKPISIKEIYVKAQVWNDFHHDRKNIRKISAIDAIFENKRLIITGDPGQGKTTFLKSVAEDADNVLLNKGLIPFLCILRNYKYSREHWSNKSSDSVEKNKESDLLEYIKEGLIEANITEAELEKILREGKGVILLDGLDEVVGLKDYDIFTEIVEFIQRYPENTFVITCRSASEPFKLESFVEVQMSDFDIKQAEDFINNWCESYEKLFPHSKQDVEHARNKILNLISIELKDSSVKQDELRTIKELTHKPLLLMMLCQVVTITGKIPSGRLDLYKKLVNTLLGGWDNERGVSRIDSEKFNKEEIISLLSDIALFAHEKNENIISQLEIEEIIKKYSALKPIEAVIRFIESQYGILVYSGFGKYSFYHKTFQEYFASFAIVEKDDDKLIEYFNKERISEPFWREVYVLIFEFLTIEKRENLIIELIRKIIKCVDLILQENSDLDNRIVEVDRIVNNIEGRVDRISKAGLRIFLSDPDYRFDSSRSLLLNLDKRIGNILVASSFINRLFFNLNKHEDAENTESYLDDFLQAFEIAGNIPKIDEADDADHALKCVYDYVKSEGFKLVSNKGDQANILVPRDKDLLGRTIDIKEKLNKIYSNSDFDIAQKAHESRELCLSFLELNEYLTKFDEKPINYQCVYNANLLLVKALNILEDYQSEALQNSLRRVIDCVMSPSNQLRNILNSEERFSGQLTDQFSIWQLARPHVNSFHNCIGELIKNSQNLDEPELLVLEIGCGDGELTKVILSSDINMKLTAIDNEPEMIEKIKSRFSSHQEEKRIHIVQDDALSYLKECKSNSFDVIVSAFTFHNFLAPYRYQVLLEVFRVLRVGGMLFDADKIAQRGDKHEQAKKWQLKKFFEILAPDHLDLLETVMLHYSDDEEPNRIRYEDVAISEFQDIGFNNVRLINRYYMDAILIASKGSSGFSLNTVLEDKKFLIKNQE